MSGERRNEILTTTVTSAAATVGRVLDSVARRPPGRAVRTASASDRLREEARQLERLAATWSLGGWRRLPKRSLERASDDAPPSRDANLVELCRGVLALLARLHDDTGEQAAREGVDGLVALGDACADRQDYAAAQSASFDAIELADLFALDRGGVRASHLAIECAHHLANGDTDPMRFVRMRRAVFLLRIAESEPERREDFLRNGYTALEVALRALPADELLRLRCEVVAKERIEANARLQRLRPLLSSTPAPDPWTSGSSRV